MFKKRTLSPQEIKQAERVRKAKDTLLEFQAPDYSRSVTAVESLYTMRI